MHGRPAPLGIALLAALAAACSHPGDPAVTTAPSSVPSVLPAATSSAPASVTAPASVIAPASAPPEGMIEIPAGVFLMGSPFSRGNPEERPMHEVIVPSFFLDRTEVTTAAYVACMDAGACSRPHETNPNCNTKQTADRAFHPINCIDWAQADAYCRFAKKRLPTEREWEYAARGGAEERRYSWGSEEPDGTRACYEHLGTCKVGSFAPGAFGLYDMTGNVWEWTSSWFGNYPHEPTSGHYRVYRGGSWSRRFPKWLVTTLRNRYEPGESSAALGVRCARAREPLVCPADTEARDGACVRVRGSPLCEPGHAWNGEACRPEGAAVARLGPADPAAPAVEKARAEEAPMDDTVVRTRTPEHDGDCKAHYPGTPAAYRFRGSTFHKRNGPIDGGGCKRRDMGQTWTSACCPG